jgi:hypothetical protein
MSPLDEFPFSAVTLSALAVSFASAWLGLAAQLIWKGRFTGDTFLDRWWDPAGFVRLFTVQRSEVHLRFSWACIVLFRAAFAVFVLFLALDLAIN